MLGPVLLQSAAISISSDYRLTVLANEELKHGDDERQLLTDQKQQQQTGIKKLNYYKCHDVCELRYRTGVNMRTCRPEPSPAARPSAETTIVREPRGPLRVPLDARPCLWTRLQTYSRFAASSAYTSTNGPPDANESHPGAISETRGGARRLRRPRTSALCTSCALAFNNRSRRGNDGVGMAITASACQS